MFYLSLSEFVCPSVCYQLLVKTTDGIFTKILQEMYPWTRNLTLHPDLGIFLRILKHCKIAIFHNFC